MNKSIQKSQLHLVEHSVSPDMPDVRSENLHLSWNKIKDARAYRVYHNGQLKQELENILYDIEPNAFGEYQISAIDFSGTESFLCKPVNISNPSEFKIVEAEEFSGSSNKSVHGFLGNGFVELDKTSDFKFNLIADSDGEYILKFRYANGNGPINTDNKCGIRALYCNGTYSAAAVFPQRGTNEWSDWGYSNPILLILNRGVNYFELKYNSFTQNMNMDVNGFFIDQVVLIKK